jgi:hypothetical protein
MDPAALMDDLGPPVQGDAVGGRNFRSAQQKLTLAANQGHLPASYALGKVRLEALRLTAVKPLRLTTERPLGTSGGALKYFERCDLE